MNIKKFEKIARLLSILLKLLGILCIISFVSVILLFIFQKNSLLTELPSVTFPIFTSINQNIPKSVEVIVGTLAFLVTTVIYFYVFFKGNQFLEQLSKGKTPFSFENYKLLKMIGLILTISSFVTPFIYSLLVTLLMPKGYYFSFGIDTNMIVGLIIYCMAEIIGYGIGLQSLSDETV